MDAFKNAVREATDLAFSECTDIISIDLIIAGVLVKLRCTDIDLASAFSGALTHHIAPESLVADWREPAIQIRIWSAIATGVPRPTMPEEIRQRIIARRARLVPDDATYQMDFDPTGHILTVMDPSLQTIDVCINNISELPEWWISYPLRSALGWILRRHNRHLVHSAAVANERGAALLLGASGAGKSCASLRCRTEGMGFLSDDVCVIGSTSDSSANVYNIYGTAKTLWSDHGVFPELNPYLVTAPTRSYKAVYALNKIPNHRIVDSSKLRTLILLDNNHPIGWTERVNPAHVVALVASTTASFLPGSGRPMLSALSEIARRLPVIRLSVGENPAQVAELIGAAIDRSSANGSDPNAA